MFHKEITILAYEVGLHWLDGQIVETLKPGKYNISKNPEENIELFDTRIVNGRISGQEIILSDMIPVRFNINVDYRIQKPEKFINDIRPTNLQETVHTAVQIEARNVISEYIHDEVLQKRKEISERIAKKVQPQLEKIGLNLEGLDVKDIILPPEIRMAYSAEFANKLQAKASLEEARGKSAVLRHMANTAGVVKNNPDLLQIMALQKDNNASMNFYFDNTKDKQAIVTKPISKKPKT